MGQVTAGFDIGGTKISLVIVDSSERELYRTTQPTDTASEALETTDERIVYHGLWQQLQRLLRAALDDLGDPSLQAIGIVSAGPIRDGGLHDSPNIVPARIDDSRRDLPRIMPLVEPMEKAFSCPTALLNDGNGAALGEAYYGVGAETRDKSSLHLAYATISTGFGVGAWDGGRLVLGKHGNAGEIGHIVARPGGLRCGCGNLGCVEAYASGSGIVRNARARLTALGDATRNASALLRLAAEEEGCPDDRSLERVRPVHVFRAADEQDPIAVAVLQDAILAAGIGFSAIANAYDPETISVGGAIALAHPDLLDPIREEMHRHLNVAAPTVVITPLGERVTERGALALGRRLLER